MRELLAHVEDRRVRDMAKVLPSVVAISVLTTLPGCGSRDTSPQKNSDDPASRSSQPLERDSAVALLIGLGPESRVCRTTFASSGDAYAMARTVISDGGATCYADREVTLYAKNGGRLCEAGRGGAVMIDADAADAELRTCLAVARRSDPSAPHSIVIASKTPDDQASAQALDATAADLYALANHGGLATTYMLAAYGLICMETDVPDDLIAQIGGADVADGRLLAYEVFKGGCAASTRTMTGWQWPN